MEENKINEQAEKVEPTTPPQPNPFAEYAKTLSGKTLQDFQAFRDYRRRAIQDIAKYKKEVAATDPKFRHTIKKPKELFIDSLSPKDQIALWKKAQRWHMNIDGENCWFDERSGIFFNYIAMKNAVLDIYPKGRFDQGVVLEGDKFTCGKDQNGITFNLESSDPFAKMNFKVSIDKNREVKVEEGSNLKGVYGAFWANDGTGTEVLEVMNFNDILACVKTTRNVKSWNEHAHEFLIKTIIKRICKQIRTDDRGFQELIEWDNTTNGNDFEHGNTPEQNTPEKILEIVKEAVIKEQTRGEETE